MRPDLGDLGGDLLSTNGGDLGEVVGSAVQGRRPVWAGAIQRAGGGPGGGPYEYAGRR